jgi:hypothetical protein
MSSPSDSVTILGTDEESEYSLLDILDHVLNAGVVIHGSVVISLAGVDLIYLGLNAVLTSVETALKHMGNQPSGQERSVGGDKENRSRRS